MQPEYISSFDMDRFSDSPAVLNFLYKHFSYKELSLKFMKSMFSTIASANYGALAEIKGIKDYNVLKCVVSRDKYVDSVDSIL